MKIFVFLVPNQPCKTSNRRQQKHNHNWSGKHLCNVYAKTREECERLLAEMILQMKAEIAAERERLKLGKPAG